MTGAVTLQSQLENHELKWEMMLLGSAFLQHAGRGGQLSSQGRLTENFSCSFLSSVSEEKLFTYLQELAP